MDDRTRQLIEAYIPHPRDPSLPQGEYFFKRETMGGPRIIRVFALDILPLRDGTEYGIYQDRGGRLVWIDSRGDGDHNRGVHMYELYDNREDCRDGTHICFDEWEGLRRLQKDALALLKAQEPRVMTLEEVLASEVVYAEDIDKTEIIPVLVDRRAYDRIALVRARLMGSPSLSIYPLISEYNKRWRCWTSRPTDEQREVTPWN